MKPRSFCMEGQGAVEDGEKDEAIYEYCFEIIKKTLAHDERLVV